MNYQYIIKFENNEIIEHPIDIQNMLCVNNNFSLDPLESGYKFFERVPKPEVEQFKKVDGCSYQLIDGVVKDVWNIVDMTEEEKQEVLNRV